MHFTHLFIGIRKKQSTKILRKEFKANFKRITNENGEVLEPKNRIWGCIKEKLKLKSSVRAIYSAAWRFVKEYRRKHRKKNKINKINKPATRQRQTNFVEEDVIKSPDDSSDDISSDSSDDVFTKSDSDKSSNEDEYASEDSTYIKFGINMPESKWRTISPTPIEYDCNSPQRTEQTRTKYVLKQGLWTSIIVALIAKQKQDLPCRFVFKNCNVYPSGEVYLKINADCKVCSSRLFGWLKSKPKEGYDVKFQFKLYHLDIEKHQMSNQKTVKLYGEAAKNIYSKNESAATIVKKLAHENLKMFELPSVPMPSENAVRCGQSRLRKKEALDDNPLMALDKLQLSNEYKYTIRGSGSNPFFTIYISPEQIAMYKEYNKRCVTKLTGDASGGFVRKFSE